MEQTYTELGKTYPRCLGDNDGAALLESRDNNHYVFWESGDNDGYVLLISITTIMMGSAITMSKYIKC